MPRAWTGLTLTAAWDSLAAARATPRVYQWGPPGRGAFSGVAPRCPARQTFLMSPKRRWGIVRISEAPHCVRQGWPPATPLGIGPLGVALYRTSASYRHPILPLPKRATSAPQQVSPLIEVSQTRCAGAGAVKNAPQHTFYVGHWATPAPMARFGAPSVCRLDGVAQGTCHLKSGFEPIALFAPRWHRLNLLHRWRKCTCSGLAGVPLWGSRQRPVSPR